MLPHTKLLETVLNIRNSTLRKLILQMETIDYQTAAVILSQTSSTPFHPGERVVLKIKKAINISDSDLVYKVKEITNEFVVLNKTSGGLCKIEAEHLLHFGSKKGEDNERINDSEQEINGKKKLNENIEVNTESEDYLVDQQDDSVEDANQRRLQKRELKNSTLMTPINDTFLGMKEQIEFCA